jgi:hypothetical protein
MPGLMKDVGQAVGGVANSGEIGQLILAVRSVLLSEREVRAAA